LFARFHKYSVRPRGCEEQLFLERISIAMLDLVWSGAAFLNGKAAFAPLFRLDRWKSAPTEKLRPVCLGGCTFCENGPIFSKGGMPVDLFALFSAIASIFSGPVADTTGSATLTVSR
jgi:hypothetical protein